MILYATTRIVWLMTQFEFNNKLLFRVSPYFILIHESLAVIVLINNQFNEIISLGILSAEIPNKYFIVLLTTLYDINIKTKFKIKFQLRFN